eukprot:2765798-Amphidinium_carterae.2
MGLDEDVPFVGGSRAPTSGASDSFKRLTKCKMPLTGLDRDLSMLLPSLAPTSEWTSAFSLAVQRCRATMPCAESAWKVAAFCRAGRAQSVIVTLSGRETPMLPELLRAPTVSRNMVDCGRHITCAA